MSVDTEVLIDLTRGLLRVTDTILLDLARLLPGSDGSAFGDVRRHLAEMLVDLDRQPDRVLFAGEDEALENILVAVGPGDPFSSLPFLSPDELRPGDLLVRCAAALSSQITELMIWSRYTHVGLYAGDGMIVDSTWQRGVRRRPLDELLGESNRIGVMRMNDLTAEQLRVVVQAAESKAPAGYNFEGIRALGVQKLEELTALPLPSLGDLLLILQRAEHLPPSATGNGTFACSELVVCAFSAIGLTLSDATGFTPGDVVRLSQAGQMAALGRLPAAQGR